MIRADTVGRRAATALGTPVWCAVPAERGMRSTVVSLCCNLTAVGVLLVAGLLGRSSSWGVLLLAAACGLTPLLAWSMTRPTLIIAVTSDGIVLLRTTVLRPCTPTGAVLETLPFSVHREAGPASWRRRPVALGYREFWVDPRSDSQIDWLTQDARRSSTSAI